MLRPHDRDGLLSWHLFSSRSTSLVRFFRGLRGLRRVRNPPGIIFFVGVRYSIECGLVSFLINLRVIFHGRTGISPASGSLAEGVGIRGKRERWNDCRSNDESPDRLHATNHLSLLISNVLLTRRSAHAV